MKKIFSFVAAALMSVAMMAGQNDLLWDYSSGAPSANPDSSAAKNGALYYGSKVDDAALKGIKMNSSGYAYFTKAAVAGKLKLTFGPRNSGSLALIVSTWSGAQPSTDSLTQITTTKTLSELGYEIIELSETQNNIYIARTSSGNEGVLQKIEFKENVARDFVDFKIEFRDNPYTVLLPASGELPAGVTVTGTSYNGGQHGVQGGTVTVLVDGTVKFTIGACQYSNSTITVKKDGVDYATISNKEACGEQKPNYNQYVNYLYMGEAGTLTFEFGSQTYVPYFFAEAAEVTPCEITFKDQNGAVLGKVETIEGATLDTLPDVSALPAIGEGNAFRGWFYTSGKKAKIGDGISGNITIQAKVTPIETATVGSVQTYDFANQFFYPEDHETVTANGGAFHDGQHGWYFNADGDIRVQVAGKAIVVVTLCTYSESGNINVMDSAQEVATYALVKNETPDGTELTAKYNGEPTELIINWTAKQYIHKVVVYNVNDFLEKDSVTGYYLVPGGDAASFLLALVQAESHDKIFLPNGTYDLGETVLTTISKNNIAIIGQSMEGTIIKNAPDAKTESIDKTATIKIAKNIQNTYLQDLTIQNALDYYKADNGRAVALWDQGTKTVCKNVRLLSYQDTYYSNLIGGVKYFEDCEIHGTVDYICGDGSVYFKRNLLYCEKRKHDGGGSDCITASNADGVKDKGYVFDSCTIQSECPVVSFGRAWNNTPQVIYLNTVVDESKGNISFESNDIQRWTKKLMNPGAWPAFYEYNTVKTDGTVLTPASNVVTFVDEKSGNATQNLETVISAQGAATYTMGYTLGEWEAGARLEAEQAVCDLENIDAAAIYLVEALNGNAELMTGAALMNEIFPEGSGITVRKANARGGFGRPAGEEPQGVEDVDACNCKVEKIIRDGQVIIIRDGKEYNALGAQIK